MNQCTCEEIIDRLRSLSSEKYKANVVKLGIPEANSIGVSTVDIRKLAKELKKSDELSAELWSSGYHEARLLAVLLMDPKQLTPSNAEALMSDVLSWDLCDHLCKNLFIKMKDYRILIDNWYNHVRIYYKRSAFTLIASAAVHDKKLDVDTVDAFYEMIRKHSNDNRVHVKKAISWALRELGKMDFNNQEKAVVIAHELIESGTKDQVWIGKDALKELENLVKSEGRRRLISADSAMGKSAVK